MSLTFTKPSKTEWLPPDTLPDLSSATEIAIDLETRDPNMNTEGPGWPTKQGEIVGFAIAVEGWRGYLPVKHEGGGNLDEGIVRRYVQSVLDSPADKIFFNAAYDVGWLWAEGFKINGRILDAMVAAALIDENRMSYSLNALSFDYLKELKSEEGLRKAAAEFGVDPKKELWKLPAMFVGEYAEQDAALTLKLWQIMKIELIKEECSSIFELETALTPLLIKMTQRGIRLNTNKAESVGNYLQAKEKDLLKQIKDICGVSVDIWAAASIARAFDKLNLSYSKTEKGSPSFTKGFLSTHPHPIAQMIVGAREYNKASGTFVQKLLNYARHDGRIHSHINQIRSDDGGTVTGRFSMNNPNLQQIPARNEEIGPMIRGLFLPEEGEEWASLDYSQQEPRLTVHYAVAIELASAMEAAKKYRENPDADFHQMVADMAKIPRKQAKTIGLGLTYGMGRAKMANELDLSDAEAASLIAQFHDGVPFLRSLITSVQARIDDPDSNGAIRTLLGRRCRFPLFEPATYGPLHKALPRDQALAEYGHPIRRAMTYKGLNRLIQGSAADQTKKALLDCYNEVGCLASLQVHDELCFSVKDRAQAEELKRVMEGCVKLEVPSKVDLEMGPSWGESA